MTKIFYAIEFQEQALIKIRERSRRSLQDVANNLNMNVGTLRKWTSKSNRKVAASAPKVRLNAPQQRKDLLQLIEKACTGGARRNRACTQIGLPELTAQRWQQLMDRVVTDTSARSRLTSSVHWSANKPW